MEDFEAYVSSGSLAEVINSSSMFRIWADSGNSDGPTIDAGPPQPIRLANVVFLMGSRLLLVGRVIGAMVECGDIKGGQPYAIMYKILV